MLAYPLSFHRAQHPKVGRDFIFFFFGHYYLNGSAPLGARQGGLGAHDAGEDPKHRYRTTQVLASPHIVFVFLIIFINI